MKNKSPNYWVPQLAIIILLFSVGTSLFPTGLLIDATTPDFYETWEPTYSYYDQFEANLTAMTPKVNVSLGLCDIIFFVDTRSFISPPVTVRVINSSNAIVFTIASFGGSSFSPGSVKLNFPRVQNYTIQFEREIQDTMFHCFIQAYVGPPAVMPIPPSFYKYWIIGFLLDILGVLLAINFIRRTKKFSETF